MSKLANKLQTESGKLVLFDQLVQIDIHQFECDTFVITKVEIVEHVNHIVHTIRIFTTQMIQNTNLFFGLSMKSFLVTNQLECNILLIFVIIGFDHLK